MKNKEIWKQVLSALIAFITTLLTIFFGSCSITRAAVSQPKDGSSTTITITTNNPQTIDTKTDAAVTFNK